MQKLVRCNKAPVEALKQLSPISAQYIMPANSKRLIRLALIMFNTVGRLGAKDEVNMLTKGLTHVGFSVTSKEWWSTEELIDILSAQLTKWADHCSIVFISVMTHGHSGTLRGIQGSEISVNKVMGLATDSIARHIPMVR